MHHVGVERCRGKGPPYYVDEMVFPYREASIVRSGPRECFDCLCDSHDPWIVENLAERCFTKQGIRLRGWCLCFVAFEENVWHTRRVRNTLSVLVHVRTQAKGFAFLSEQWLSVHHRSKYLWVTLHFDAAHSDSQAAGLGLALTPMHRKLPICCSNGFLHRKLLWVVRS